MNQDDILCLAERAQVGPRRGAGLLQRGQVDQIEPGHAETADPQQIAARNTATKSLVDPRMFEHGSPNGTGGKMSGGA